MTYLLDTNILVRWAKPHDSQYRLATDAIRKLTQQAHTLHTSPQNYVEFWNVATRPVSANGLGLAISDTHALVLRLGTLFPLLPDTDAIFPKWLNLVIAAGVSGKLVHDARLVAVMLAHGVGTILTFDTDDFDRYRPFGISPVHPAAV